MTIIDRETTLAKLALTQDGVHTREQAAALGFSAYLIRRAHATGRWRELLPDVFAASTTPLTVATRERAVLLWLGTEAALSEFSAARVHRLGVREAGPPRVWVSVPHRYAALRLARQAHGYPVRVNIHATRHPESQRIMDGRRVTSVARTLVDLARFLDHDALAGAYLAALQREACTVEQVRGRAMLVRGRAGSALAAAVAAEFDPAFESLLGAELHGAFAAAGIRLRAGVTLVLPGGETIKPDGYDERLRLLVEADGWAWHGTSKQVAADKARDRRAMASGLFTVRYDTGVIRRNPAFMIEDFRKVAARRELDLGLSLRAS